MAEDSTIPHLDDDDEGVNAQDDDAREEDGDDEMRPICPQNMDHRPERREAWVDRAGARKCDHHRKTQSGLAVYRLSTRLEERNSRADFLQMRETKWMYWSRVRA